MCLTHCHLRVFVALNNPRIWGHRPREGVRAGPGGRGESPALTSPPHTEGAWLSSLCSSFVEETLVQFSSVTQLCPTLCDPMDCNTPGFPVHHHLLEFTQTHVQ